MYADAKFLIKHDVTSGSLAAVSSAALKFIEQRMKEDRMLIYHDFERWASDPKTASNIFLVFEGRTYTYKQFFDLIGQVGNWLLKEFDIQKHEIVAIDGGNTPEYLLLWFGLEAIGAAPAFINNNLTQDPLVHSVKLCSSRFLIADEDVRSLVEPCREQLESANCRIIFYNQALFESLQDYSTIPPADRRKGFQPTEIYAP